MNNQNRIFHLLKRRRFAPYFATQFLGAFNDNVFKNALILLIAFELASGEAGHILVNAAAGLFVLPFFLFSSAAGQLADKYEKGLLIRRIKLAEVLIMGLGALALFSGSVTALLTVLFLMGTQSSFFGPVKYGLLPQHLDEHELMAGNGLVEMGTFLAILLGTLAGGVLFAWGGVGWVAITVVACALIGLLLAQGIPRAAPVAPELRLAWNPIRESGNCLRYAAEQRLVRVAMLGISWFWFLGSLYLAQLPNYTRLHLAGDERMVTGLLAVFALGIGLGSILAARLARGRVEPGLMPLGAMGLTLAGLDLWLGTPAEAALTLRTVLDLALIGVFGGLFVVPLYALVQQRGRREVLSRIIAAINIQNALFMVSAAILAGLLLGVAGLSIPQLFLLAAIANALVLLALCRLEPAFWTQCRRWVRELRAA
ncbi:MFS transporter [Alkalilimnicola sp. S0819]|uniref:MFS transporter n=1 Tax=Alkalilimnicola sp. S0819 TaxID=2613922 RepID=UPI001261BC81|nr:MFS transporter [Alkalilimnicola sp. S0819]KAB7624294.1 MFS transporter [Alkalilimnicola sp. S0819]MPQ16118.1 MFS transporter [Alkalilimnicola sp. S0819]